MGANLDVPCTFEQDRELTLRLVFLPEVIEALKARWALQSQLAVEVPEQEGDEDDEESDGGQKPQHLWRDWDAESLVSSSFW